MSHSLNEVLNNVSRVDEAQICGSTYLVRGCHGPIETIEDLKREPGSEPYHAMLDAIGFSAGYRFGDDVDIMSDKVQEDHALYTAAAVYRAADKRGWIDNRRPGKPTIDELLVSSVSSRRGLKDRVVEILEENDISVGRATPHEVACASIGTGLATLTKHLPEGGRGMDAGANSLSGSLVPRGRLDMRATFHNAFGAVAVEAEDADVLVFVGKVVHDEYGVIRLPKMNGDLPTDPGVPWDNFEVGGDATGEVVFFNEYGMIKSIPALKGTEEERMPGDNREYAFMDGKETGLKFKHLGGELAYRAFSEYRRTMESRFGLLGPGYAHPPSKPVLDGINKYYAYLQRMALKNGEEFIPQNVAFDWLMYGRGVSNSSDFTILDYLMEQNVRGNLQPEVATPWDVCGVGETVAAGVTRWRRPVLQIAW